MWSVLWWLMLLVYVAACICLILVVLLQKGKGTGFAGAFGVGPGGDASMGPRRRKTIVVRATQWSAGAFMVLALLMSIISGRVQQAKAPERVAEEDVETSPLSELEHLGEEYEDGAEGDGLAPPAGVQDPPVPAEDPVEAPELLEPEMSPDEAEAEAAESETPLEDESAPEDEAEAASESGAAGAGGEGR